MQSLGDAVDVFSCCVFTWNLVSIVLPAFLVAGALVVFVPSYAVMKYMGAKAKRIVSYGMAAISGNVLTVCSCNVV
ncbi:MAG: permease, partial [Armatimonadetes bacterium]|nr:permease [Armatimonadota bacterium]